MLENRYRGDHGNDCLMTLDCTTVSCECDEVLSQNKNNPAFPSFKLYKRSALPYELGVCILTGDLCWISGGWPAGRYADADVSILRRGLERVEVEADDGYTEEAPEKVRCLKCITTLLERKRMMTIV